MKWWDQMPWSSFSECWALNQLFHSPFTFIRRLFRFYLLSAIRVMSSAYLRLLIFLPGNLDSSLCFIQPGILHDVLCIEVKLPGWPYTALTYSFPYLELVHCSMSTSNCCFLTCIQISQEACQVVWYSHLLMTFPHFVLVHAIKGLAYSIKQK